MKTVITVLVMSCLISLGQAQNDLAMVVKKNDATSMKKTSSTISTYLSENTNKVKCIDVLRSQVENFNVETLEEYIENDPATYDVTFQQGKNKIEAIYNHDGELLSTNEIYFDVRLPYDLASDLSHQFPNCSFSNTSCNIVYDVTNGTQTYYKIDIEKSGKKIKTVKISI